MLREARNKGYRRGNAQLPTTCASLRTNNFARDAFFDIFISDGQQNAHLIGASLETDTNSADGSRAFLDIWLDPQNPNSAILQLTLTNNWSDDPAALKAPRGSLTINGENGFFVDVARFLPVNVAGGSPVLRIFWYRYWWNDARPHSWWWYGGYSWWYREYACWGVTSWWWWHMWWIWWHGYHWWWWSNWWADLNPVHQQ